MLKIKELREKRGLTQYQLAKQAGLNYRTIPAIENGGDVRVSTLQSIAKVLQVKVKDLFE